MKHRKCATILTAGLLLLGTTAFAQFVPGSSQSPYSNSSFGMKGKRNGPNDGTGNQGQRPMDGTGYGAKSGRKGGSGTCDGTGPSTQGRGSMGGRGSRR